MKTFTNIEEAFKWWLTNVYPGLPADVKKGRLTTAWRNYTHKQSLSQEMMLEILKEFGFKVAIKITYQP